MEDAHVKIGIGRQNHVCIETLPCSALAIAWVGVLENRNSLESLDLEVLLQPSKLALAKGIHKVLRPFRWFTAEEATLPDF